MSGCLAFTLTLMSMKRTTMSRERTSRTKQESVNNPEALYRPKRFHLARPGGSLQV